MQRLDKFALFDDLGYEPHDGQRVIHASDARVRVVACGARFGKTLCAAMEAIAAALQPAERSIGWCVAPTYDLSDRVYSQIEIVVFEHLRHRLIVKKQAERRIVNRNLSGGTSEIRAKSADNPDSLLGEGLDFVIIDEAARLKPRIVPHVARSELVRARWAGEPRPVGAVREHSTPVMTMRHYVHLDVEDLREGVERAAQSKPRPPDIQLEKSA